MSDQIQFEGEGQEQSLLYGRFERSAQVPTMVRWALSTGVVKDEHGAKYLLLAVVVLAVLSAIMVLSFFGSSSTPTPSGFKEGQSVLVPSPSKP